MKQMKEAIVPTLIKFDDDLKERLRTICDATRLRPIDIIRMAVEQYVNKAEKDGGILLTIPPKEKQKEATPSS